MAATSEHFVNPISDSELQRRWDATRKVLARREIDAIVVQNSNDYLGGYVRWFSGMPATNAYPRSVIFYPNQQMTIVEQGAFESHIEPPSGNPLHRGVAHWLGTPSYSSALYTVQYDVELILANLKKAGAKRVGVVNPGGMYFPFGKAISDEYGEKNIVDVTDDVDALMAVKSAEEMALIVKTAELQDSVIEAVRTHLRPGLKDYEVAAFAQYRAQTLGSEQGIFLAGSAPCGQAAVFKPRVLQGREIQKGDCFTLLVEVNGPGGYYTEIARTFVLGAVPAEVEDGLQAALDAQKRCLALLKPGARSKDIFDAHNDYMASRGLPTEKRLHCHGQGYNMVERPLIRSDEDMTIAEGMNIVVHPGYVTDKVFAVICDNYLVGPEGVQPCIHKTPQKIIAV